MIHRESTKSKIVYVVKCQNSALPEMRKTKANHMSYIGILNKNLPPGVLPIKQSETIKIHLQNKCNFVRQSFKQMKLNKIPVSTIKLPE